MVVYADFGRFDTDFDRFPAFDTRLTAQFRRFLREKWTFTEMTQLVRRLFGRR